MDLIIGLQRFPAALLTRLEAGFHFFISHFLISSLYWRVDGFEGLTHRRTRDTRSWHREKRIYLTSRMFEYGTDNGMRGEYRY